MEAVLKSYRSIRTMIGICGDSLLWAVAISAAVSTAVILGTVMF